MADKIQGSDLAVRKFQQYLRIRSDHPNPDYESAVKFLDEYAKELELDLKHVQLGKDGRVIVIMTWPGKNPALSSVVLNSHTDVVTSAEEHWKYPPFGGVKDENGDIYGSGAQDMKCVGIQYLEAIRILKLQRKMQFERTIHLTFMQDEAIGGSTGMKLFVATPEFKSLNLGFALDEGFANPGNKYSVFYGERYAWWVQVKCVGTPGSGTRFIKNTAAEKLAKVIDKFLQFRNEEAARMEGTCLMLGDVTTVNLTMLEGGILPNVVPSEFIATFDIRIPPSVDMKEIEEKIKSWCLDSGKDVTYTFLQKNLAQRVTDTSEDDPWWNTFSKVLEKRGVEISKEIFPALTDSRYLRELGYPAIGFSPMRNTPILLHDHNEFLNESIFLEGIDVYCDLIPALANNVPV